MPDTAIAESFTQTVDTRYADAAYNGQVVLVEQGPTIDTAMAEVASATIYDCYGNQQLTINTSQALTLQISRTPTEVSVNFTLSTVVDVDYTRCDGTPGHFSGALSMVGNFTFNPKTASCADLKSWCGDSKSWCGDGHSSGSTGGSGFPSGFNVDVDSAFTFSDGTANGAGVLMITDNQVALFSGLANAGDGAQGVMAVFFGALTLASLLGGDQPFEGISPMDALLMKAMGGAAAYMAANPTEAGAQAATIGVTGAGLALIFDYTQLSLAVADVTPSSLALSASTDGGTKGDGLTNARQVTIDGLAGKYAAITLYDGDKVVGTGKADAAGVFHVTTSSLSEGTHTLTAVAKDAAGVAGKSDAFTVTVDSKLAQPTVGAVGQAGVSGLADAGAKVAVYDGSTLLGTVTAGADGKWALAATLNAKTIHTITASASDAAGNKAVSDDTLYGASSGKLTGGYGDDVLVGSDGATLTGGYGHDVFVYDQAGGKTIIADFKAGTDDLRVIDPVVDTWAELKALAKQQGADVVITFDATHTITLKSVALSSLSAGDFLFG